MSVLSTLALLVTTAAVKLKPEREDPARAIAELRAEADELRRECTDWRARAEVWRERALANIPAPQPAGPDFRPPELAQRQLWQWAQAQQNAVAQQNAQMLQQGMQQTLQSAAAYGQGMMPLGSQQMSALDPEMWCNCVPSRAQVWAANGPEA